MGLETVRKCSIDHLSSEAKVLLEARELIIRAPFRQTIKIADLDNIRVAGEELRLSFGSTAVALHLGAETAEKWARKIVMPPPSLGQRLGIGHASPAFVIRRRRAVSARGA